MTAFFHFNYKILHLKQFNKIRAFLQFIGKKFNFWKKVVNNIYEIVKK